MMQRMISAGFFVLRTPTLPWDTIEEWCQDLLAARTFQAGGDVEAALRKDTALLRDRLREIVRCNAVRSALYIASPSLCGRLAPWLDGDESVGALSVEPAIVRYCMRMAGRATPFGLFAGTSVGTIGQRTHLSVPPRIAHLRHTRLDMGYVFDLAEQLSNDLTLRPHLRFRTTTTAYHTGGRLRYYEPRVSGQLRTYHLVDVDPTPHLHTALEFAQKTDGVTIREAANAICAAFCDVDLRDAIEYVHELINAKLLCSTLSAPLTGPDAVFSLIGQLRTISHGRGLADELEDVLHDIRRIDDAGFDTQPGQYDKIAVRLRRFATDLDMARLFRVDLRKPCVDAQLGSALVEDLAKGVKLLAGIAFHPDESKESAMSAFVREFEIRYHGGEIPLLQALDEETGIGFDIKPRSGGEASSLLDGIAFREPSRRAIGWSGRENFLLVKLGEALRSGASEIALTHADMQALSSPTPPKFPPGLGVLASISAPSGAAFSKHQYLIYLRKCFGTTSAKLLGRFCQGDAELERHVRAALITEEACDPDVLHAEIVHLPQGRAGNVIGRPVLRAYEIPVFGKSGAPEDCQIALADLFVSVERGKVLLRSGRHGRRVIPHLTCAHAFRGSGLGIYRFLASLDEQGVLQDFAFSWGPFASTPFLPRVRHGKFVLSLARWSIPGHTLTKICELHGAARFSALQDLRACLKLPRFVWFEDGDQCLPVDLENALSLESFVSEAKHKSTLTLSEIFPSPDELVVCGEEGRFHHELIVPFVRKAIKESLPRSTRGLPVVPSRPDRARHLGDDWLFVKMYCGVAALDRVLCHVILPLVRDLQADFAIDRWFFVRQSDPKLHLRLRLKGNPACLWCEVAPRLFAAMRKAGDLIQNGVIDTYNPEEERYGGKEGLAIAEQLFEADSDAAVSVLAEYGADAEVRWRLALLGMDALLGDFGLSLEQKKQVVRICRSEQLSHFENDKYLNRQMGNKYRRLRLEIETLLNAPPLRYTRGIEAIRTRSRRLVELATRLRMLEDEQRLQSPLHTIVGSFLHMWANRIFRDSTNAQELVLYDFLYRVYDGRIGRNRAMQSGDPGAGHRRLERAAARGSGGG